MTYDLTRFSKPIAFAVLVTVAACTGSTDPATATLFDNINNLNSGEYDRQIASNKAQANAIIAQNQAAEQRNAQLAAQKNANQQQINALRSQIAEVKAQGAKARPPRHPTRPSWRRSMPWTSSLARLKATWPAAPIHRSPGPS